MTKEDYYDVCIDAGHGGADHGAMGNGLSEKHLNLRMSLYQYNRLKKLGAKVLMTRYTDKYLNANDRTKIVRDSNARICISNHFNAFSNNQAHGVETIHSIFSNGAKANFLLNEIVKTSGLHRRNAYSRNWGADDYYFMHRLTGKVESVIIEYGFITNKNDMDYYRNDKNFYAVAETVVKTLCDILSIEYKTESELNKNVENETVKQNYASVHVALQDLQLTENQWKTKIVNVKGTGILNENVHIYAGSPNFDNWITLLEKGTEIEFNQLAIPHKSDLVWLSFNDYMTSEIRWIPIGTIDGFNTGKLWLDFK